MPSFATESRSAKIEFSKWIFYVQNHPKVSEFFSLQNKNLGAQYIFVTSILKPLSYFDPCKNRSAFKKPDKHIKQQVCLDLYTKLLLVYDFPYVRGILKQASSKIKILPRIEGQGEAEGTN